MPQCAVPGCTKPGVHIFPKDTKLKKKWEKAIRRKNFVATRHSRVCRNHFKESDYVGESAYTGNPQICRFLKKGTVPSMFPWSTQVATSPTSRSLRYLEISKCRNDFRQPTVENPSKSVEIEISTIESSSEVIKRRRVSSEVIWYGRVEYTPVFKVLPALKSTVQSPDGLT